MSFVGTFLDALVSKVNPSVPFNFLWVDFVGIITGTLLIIVGFESLLFEAAFLLMLLAALRLRFKQFLVRAGAIGSISILSMTTAAATGKIPLDELWVIPGHGLILLVAFAFSADREERSLALDEAKSRLLATVSHDIRNPLTAALGMAELLSDADPEDVDKFTGTIIRAVQEALYLVEDLSTSTRLDAGTLRLTIDEVDVLPLLESMASGIENEFPITVEAGEGGLVCLGDEMRLRQIIRNLISNAQRYGGSHIRLKVETENDLLLIEVIDDGPGVPETATDHIFEAFTQVEGVDRPADSMGLGLASARQLARQMGGDLNYRRLASVLSG